MSYIIKCLFIEIALDESNYLTWDLEIEIYLVSMELTETIVSKSHITNAQKAQAFIFPSPPLESRP